MTRYNELFAPIDSHEAVFMRTWTPAQPQRTVLCVHGSGGNSADFARLASALSSNESECPMKVIAFDAPGNGLSPANPGVSAFHVQRQVIEKFVSNSAGPIALIASSGGAIATLVALQTNKRKTMTGQIPVVFAEPGFGYSNATHDYVKRCMPFFTGQYTELNQAVMTWNQTPLAHVLFDSDADKSSFIQGRLKVDQNMLVAASRELNADELKHFNVLHGMPPFSNPCLLLWGEKGGLMEQYDEAFRKKAARCQQEVFANAGHPLSLTRAKEIQAIAHFLRTTPHEFQTH